jgi:hypothetical protein
MDVKHFLVSVMQNGEESQVVSEAVWVASLDASGIGGGTKCREMNAALAAQLPASTAKRLRSPVPPASSS